MNPPDSGKTGQRSQKASVSGQKEIIRLSRSPGQSKEATRTDGKIGFLRVADSPVSPKFQSRAYLVRPNPFNYICSNNYY